MAFNSITRGLKRNTDIFFKSPFLGVRNRRIISLRSATDARWALVSSVLSKKILSQQEKQRSIHMSISLSSIIFLSSLMHSHNKMKNQIPVSKISVVIRWILRKASSMHCWSFWDEVVDQPLEVVMEMSTSLGQNVVKWVQEIFDLLETTLFHHVGNIKIESR